MTSPGIQGIIEPDVAISSAKATNEAIHGTFVEPPPSSVCLLRLRTSAGSQGRRRRARTSGGGARGQRGTRQRLHQHRWQ
jgi:hypothetical protein